MYLHKRLLFGVSSTEVSICNKIHALYFKKLVIVKVDPEFEQNNTIKIEGVLYFGYKPLKYSIQWRVLIHCSRSMVWEIAVRGNRIKIKLYLQNNSLGLDPVNVPISNPNEVMSS